MTPQEDSKPGRKRRDGNITYIRTQFATRVRSAIITLAKREAREAIKLGQCRTLDWLLTQNRLRAISKIS